MQPVRISKIKIENYRSISKHPALDLSNINIFVGNNDAGKSNILKALDLFFNHSNSRSDDNFNFNRDYCCFSKIPAKTAPQIKIDITFKIPTSYKGSDKTIVWTKTWRKSGILKNSIKLDGGEISFQSKIPTLLRSIRYNYVPAIKGRHYFSSLLEDVHDMLADTVEYDIRQASGNFTKIINKHTSPILAEIEERLGFKSSLALPANLRELFATLDFKARIGGKSFSLLQRGDGIQVQHIPIILKFLADQANINITKGSVPAYTIWGYEEPENNLEMLNATILANQLLGYSEEIQILLTTHSPAFYSLASQEDSNGNINLFTISKDKSNTSQIDAIDDVASLDKTMGILPAIIPTFNQLVQEHREIEKKASKLHSDEPTVFVEGLTDKAIITRAIELYDNELLTHIKILSEKGAGSNWVYDMLMAWLYKRHLSKAMGLFDIDSAGITKCKQFNKTTQGGDLKQRVDKAYAIRLDKPKHLLKVFQNGIKIPIAIEEMFPINVWRYAEKMDWLEKRPDILKYNNYNDPDKAFNDFCSDKLSDNKDLMLYIEYRVAENHKEEFKKHVVKERTKTFASFKNIVDKIRQKIVD